MGSPNSQGSTIFTRRRFLEGATAVGSVSIAGCTDQLTGSDGGSADFPSQPITMIVPYGTGSPSDTDFRKIAEVLSGEYDVDVEVENITGGGSLRGIGEVQNREANGYTVGQTYVPSYLVSHINQEPGWDATDFRGICSYNKYQTCLITHEDNDIETFEDLFTAYSDGDLSQVGGLGRGHAWHLQFALLRDRAGYEWETYVNYDEGQGAIHQAVSTQEVGSALSSLAGAVPKHNSDESPIQIIGTTASQSDIFPDIPSWDETEYESIDWLSTFTNNIVAPPETPDDVIGQWEEVSRTVLSTDEIQEYEPDQPFGFLANSQETEDLLEETYENLQSRIDWESLDI